MIDLSIRYLGLSLNNPLVCSASPLCGDINLIRRMEEAGAAAIVLPSLFEEQLEIESQAPHQFLNPAGEELSYLPDMQEYNLGPDGYLDLIRSAKAAVDIPIIASLNGSAPGGWIGFSRRIEEAGADALELNIYWVQTDPSLTSPEIELLYADLVSEVKAHVHIPVAVKVSPFFTSFASFARQLDQAGADGLVLFNSFLQPAFDIDHQSPASTLQLPSPAELLLRLHWAAILFGHVRADLAVSGGVQSKQDVLKVLMAGGRVAMMTTALLRRGIDHLTFVLLGLEEWLREHEFGSIEQLLGSMSLLRVSDPSAYERANYMKMIRSFNLQEIE